MFCFQAAPRKSSARKGHDCTAAVLMQQKCSRLVYSNHDLYFCAKQAEATIAQCSLCTLPSFTDALALKFKTAISSKICSSTGLRLQ